MVISVISARRLQTDLFRRAARIDLAMARSLRRRTQARIVPGIALSIRRRDSVLSLVL